MKAFITMGICAFALTACSSNPKEDKADSLIADSTAAADNVNIAPGHVCFLHTDGTANQDSTTVHLVIDGEKVSGEMNWLPKEKDSRKGTIQGTQTGNIIKAVWTFSQEGMQDTMAVEFSFPGDRLAQKPLKADTKTGRQVTDAKAGYTVLFEKVDCK